nr:cytochrome c-type biogenesis protein CcmH [Anaerolineaceae bacterium]
MTPLRKVLAILFVLACASLPAVSVQAQEDNPVTDDEVNRLASELYCPVCENVPLEVCPTKACAQWRELIREKMSLGWSDEQIKEYFATQYGEQVLAIPPRRGFNWLIYVVPPLLVIIGGLLIARIIKRSRKLAPLPASNP